jgi:hypothetical protein
VRQHLLKAALIGVSVLSIGGAALLTTGTGANATTLDCTNTQSAVTSPDGCGGLQIAQPYGGGLLDMSTNGNVYDSAPVTVEPDSINAASEDFTVFAVGGSTTDGPGGLGEYVAMITPDGKVSRFTVTTAGPAADIGGCVGGLGTTPGTVFTNAVPCGDVKFTAGPTDYCLSVSQFVGPNGKDRWWALDKLCSTNGTFTYGTNTTTGSVSPSFANRWQVWAPVTGSHGLQMVNISLRNKSNSNYDLNITGSGGPGVQLQAYPDNTGGSSNDSWDYIACTPPGTLLSVFGTYGAC